MLQNTISDGISLPPFTVSLVNVICISTLVVNFIHISYDALIVKFIVIGYDIR